MANLRDAIRLEIEWGNLQEPFSLEEVRRQWGLSDGKLGGQTYLEKSIGETLANHSTGPGTRSGEAVKRGGLRLFKKHEERATYSIDYSTYDTAIDEAYESMANASTPERHAIPMQEGESATGRAVPPKRPRAGIALSATQDEIADRFVVYLRNKPFRLLLNTPYGATWGPPPVIGWNNRVKAYVWNGVGWIATATILDGFIADLSALEIHAGSLALREGEALRIYNEIRTWGNPKGVKRKGADVLRLLNQLWTTGTVMEVDSTLTKLYAFARPHEYAIYDSRVAAAIMTIAEDVFRRRTIAGRLVDTIAAFRNAFSALGLYNGVGGTRQRGYRSRDWPNAYGNVAAQTNANSLCKKVVSRLNAISEDGRTNWSMREVEAILFMEGY